MAYSKQPPRIPVEGDARHIHRVEEALSRAEIRFRIVGGMGSGGRVWGHATFEVDSLQEARKHLRGAGFLESPEGQHVLVDSENGWKIRLL